MKIKNLKSFCITDNGEIGIAQEGTFAASAWLISDDAYNSISGKKFSWIAPNGGHYTDDKEIFSRPTEEQVINNISSRLKEIALEQNIIEL